MELCNVTFLPHDKTIKVPAGTNLLEAALSAGILVDGACGGEGICGKCRARLIHGNSATPNKADRNFFSKAELAKGWVLTCQQKVWGDIVVKLSKDEKYDKNYTAAPAKGIVEGYALQVDSPLTKIFLDLSDTDTCKLPYLDRLLVKLPVDTTINYETFKNILPVISGKNTKVTTVLFKNRVMTAEPGDTTVKKYGLALDLGTTTIAGYLLDLNTGQVVASDSTFNQQFFYGADIISRLAYATNTPGGSECLQQLVVKSIDSLLTKMSLPLGVEKNNIYEVVAVGNTAMSHLLLGIKPVTLVAAPFRPYFRGCITVETEKLHFKTLPGHVNLTLLPGIGGFVGSDTTAVILATSIAKRQGNWLIVDLGTNGEIVLSGKGRMLACSTAAGPAFEAVGIKHGMGFGPGAINKVFLDGDLRFNVVGDVNAKGICGSGLVDLVSLMVGMGLLGKNGRIKDAHNCPANLPDRIKRRIRAGKEGNEFVITEEPEIVIAQQDIIKLLLAKGAIKAGIEILLGELGIQGEDLDGIFLAGAFGSSLTKHSIFNIGMLPHLPFEKIISTGNSAGLGALKALSSIVERKKAEELSGKVEYVELATYPSFNSCFARSLFFPQVE